jgi:hypothetical protein
MVSLCSSTFVNGKIIEIIRTIGEHSYESARKDSSNVWIKSLTFNEELKNPHSECSSSESNHEKIKISNTEVSLGLMKDPRPTENVVDRHREEEGDCGGRKIMDAVCFEIPVQEKVKNKCAPADERIPEQFSPIQRKAVHTHVRSV